jgi:hypothetical protein
MQVKPLMKSRPLWGSQFAHKASWFFHRGFINGFFFAHSTSDRTPSVTRVQPDCVEEKGYTVRPMSRGQFPNNPCDWSDHQVEGLNES